MPGIRADFDEHGFVRLNQAFPDEVGGMVRALWAELARRHGIAEDRPSTWTTAEPRGLAALRRAGVFDPLATPRMRAAITEILGDGGWPRPFSWGDPLVTFPTAGPWNVPTTGWHLDFPARGSAAGTLLLKWLGYLAPVHPGGGGTVVLAGSHRLVGRYLTRTDPSDPGRSPELRDAIFGTDPWLRSIREPGDPAERAARLLERGATVDGVPVRVVELTGQPGDVVFMHPHLFHAPAPNRSAAPRLMVTGGLTRG